MLLADFTKNRVNPPNQVAKYGKMFSFSTEN